MQQLLKELELIEAENKVFFEKKNVRLYQYISVSKMPVMIRFIESMDNKIRLPDIIYKKVNKLVMSYYGK
ncbi:MAG: hypothetical protein ABI388_08495 [Bacteroidia bacterium]